MFSLFFELCVGVLVFGEVVIGDTRGSGAEDGGSVCRMRHVGG